MVSWEKLLAGSTRITSAAMVQILDFSFIAFAEIPA
jgi:hypothetical protein